MALANLIPKMRGTPIVANAERIFQSTTDFIRGNPVVSTLSVGAGVTGLGAIVAVARSRRKKAKKKTTRKKATTRKKTTRKRKKKTQAQIKRTRLRNLAKARRARKCGKRKKHIIRGRGLGRHEIKHSGRGTKGKTKIVQFRNKKTGKMVRFKVRK